ncbi:hypothetical protein I0C86_17825 [Plantactinospora sp. S1510]|uniref:ABC transporter permease n=1 Tax=Plantactinospora alkalitolerans TaxID=2789879 RepID=A0ABS0GX72_9ACTN|nr:DUF6297 family protein [Plantactinospora alkalitolerans]MBF9130804.1 hypothetical protein [Plantactinospora alkalitolerans]
MVRSGPAGASPAAPVRSYLRARGRARAGGYAERAYALLLALLVAGGILAGSLPGMSTAFADGPPVRPGPGTLLAIGLLCYAAVLGGAARFGPLAAAPARLSWLFPSPTSRRGLLWPTAAVVLGLATVLGLLHGAFVAWALVAPMGLLVVLAGGIAGLFVGGLATLTQTFTEGSAALLDRSALLLGAAAAALTVFDLPARIAVGGWFGPWAWPQAAADGMSPAALGTAGVLAAAVAGAALVRLDRVRLAGLATGGAFAGTLSSGVVTLDLGTAARVTEERRWARRSPRRTGLPRLPARLAVLAHDVLALRRSPDRLALISVAALPPALLAGVTGPGPLLAGAWLLSGLLAVGAVTDNARRDRDLPALARLLGLPGRRLLAVRSILPTVVGTAWGAGSLALLAASTAGNAVHWLLLGAVSGPALAVGALRAARRGAVRHELPPVVTPMGMVPTGPLHRLVTGWDLGLLCTLPTLVAVAAGDPAGAVPVQVAASLLGLFGFVAVAGARRTSPRSLS